MIQVKQVVNEIFISNTFLISQSSSTNVWLIDVGNIEGVLKSLSVGSQIAGVFITHAHYDHIYGINKLIEAFPACILFASEQTKEGLFSDKLNLSFYHEDPIIFNGSNVQILHENNKIELFNNCYLEVIETPGHNWGCLTFKVENYLFTGDSFIPNVEVVTKLKGGNKEANKKSLQKIMDNISNETIVCPGHGMMNKIKK